MFKMMIKTQSERNNFAFSPLLLIETKSNLYYTPSDRLEVI